MSRRISVSKAKQRLTAVWLIGAGISFGVIFIQTISGVFDIQVGNDQYESIVKDVWSWLFPSIIPTLSLMIGVVVAESLLKPKAKTASRFLYRLSFILSTVYLVTLIVTHLAAVAAPLDKSPEVLLEQSSLWLGPFQGLVTASLGAFFVSKE